MFKTPEGGGDQPKPLNGLIGDYVDKVVDMTKLTGIQQKNGRQYWSKSEKGFYISPNINSHSEFVPGPSNAAKLELMSDPLKNNSTASHYVFVKDVSVGWGLNYTTSQTVAGKTFYPHDVSYKYAMVRGQTQSQYEYDKLVEWVMQSQVAALSHAANVVRFVFPRRLTVVRGVGTRGADKNIAKIKGMSFQGVIETIKAGHTKEIRGNNAFAPEFELKFMLLSFKNDFLIESGLNSEADPIDANREFAKHVSLTGGAAIVANSGANQIPADEAMYGSNGYGVGGPDVW